MVAVCAGSDVMHPIGAFITGGMAGGLFVFAFNQCQNKWRIDDVLGVWPLHGLCGLMGGVLCGVFGQEVLGGLGGVSLGAQISGTAIGATLALGAGLAVYGGLKATIGIRLSDEEEFMGADLALHQITAYPEDVTTIHDEAPLAIRAAAARAPLHG